MTWLSKIPDLYAISVLNWFCQTTAAIFNKFHRSLGMKRCEDVHTVCWISDSLYLVSLKPPSALWLQSSSSSVSSFCFPWFFCQLSKLSAFIAFCSIFGISRELSVMGGAIISSTYSLNHFVSHYLSSKSVCTNDVVTYWSTQFICAGEILSSPLHMLL